MAVSLDGEHWHGIELDPELYANTGRGIYEVMRLGASGFMFVANRPGRRHIRQTVKTPALANCAEGGHLRVDIVYTASSGL